MDINKDTIMEIAKNLEFDLVGFAKAEPLTKEIIHLKEWLKRGYSHKMSYMEKNLDKREDVRKILPSARSVISLGINYYKSEAFENNKGYGKVSRYAWGRDYHFIIWEKLREFEEALRKKSHNSQFVSYVDTGPVMDKAWAVKSGIGWLGKHTNIISRKIGSWFFIANIITDVELEESVVHPDLCGTCTACLDACPTDAFVQEYVLDASKCISNLTIENKGEIPGEFKGKFANWVFGCDICQDVCPWNKKGQKPADSAHFRETSNKEIKLDEVKQLTNTIFKKQYFESPLLRTGLKGLKRNSDFLEDKPD